MKLPQKIALSFFLLFSITSFAQKNEKTNLKDKTVVKYPKNEIRIIAENFFGNKNYDYYYYSNSRPYYSYDQGTNTYFNNRFRYGLGYNLNFNHIGFRSKVFFSNYDESSNDARNAVSRTTSTMFRGSIGVNYQKHLKKVVLFAGADFGYFKVNLKYDYNTNSTNNQAYAVSSDDINYSGYSIQPLVGFKYFFSDNFSISSEIRFIIDKYSGNSQSIFIDYNGFTSTFEYNFDGISTQLGPLGSISLNIHF